jgi:hypothetical protein
MGLKVFIECVPAHGDHRDECPVLVLREEEAQVRLEDLDVEVESDGGEAGGLKVLEEDGPGLEASVRREFKDLLHLPFPLLEYLPERGQVLLVLLLFVPAEIAHDIPEGYM